MCRELLDVCDAYLPALGAEARDALEHALCNVDARAVAWVLIEAVNTRPDATIALDDDVVALTTAFAAAKSYMALLKAWVRTFRERAGMASVGDETVELVATTRGGGISSPDGFRALASHFMTPQITTERMTPVMRKSTPPLLLGGTTLQEFQ